MKSVFIDVTIVVVLVVVNIIWCCLTDELGYSMILLSLWFAAMPSFLF